MKFVELFKSLLAKIDGQKSNTVASIAGSAGVIDLLSGNPEQGAYGLLGGAAVYALRDSMRKILSYLKVLHDGFEKIKEHESRLEQLTQRIDSALTDPEKAK